MPYNDLCSAFFNSSIDDFRNTCSSLGDPEIIDSIYSKASQAKSSVISLYSGAFNLTTNDMRLRILNSLTFRPAFVEDMNHILKSFGDSGTEFSWEAYNMQNLPDKPYSVDHFFACLQSEDNNKGIDFAFFPDSVVGSSSNYYTYNVYITLTPDFVDLDIFKKIYGEDALQMTSESFLKQKYIPLFNGEYYGAWFSLRKSGWEFSGDPNLTSFISTKPGIGTSINPIELRYILMLFEF